MALTPAGAKAYQEHQTGRVRAVAALLGRLPEDDLDDLQRLLEKVQELLDITERRLAATRQGSACNRAPLSGRG